MALQKTKVLNITSVTGIATVGILTAGVTPTDAGVAGTCYIKKCSLCITLDVLPGFLSTSTLIPIHFYCCNYK